MIKLAVRRILSYIVLVAAVIGITQKTISFQSFILTLIWFELVQITIIRLKGDA